MGFWDELELDRPGSRYEVIRDAIVRGIQTGQLKPGRRLPSHRFLADRLDVSVNTVTRAYKELLNLGFISGSVGRGSYVRLAGSPPLKVISGRHFAGFKVDLCQNLPVPVGGLEHQAWTAALEHLGRESDFGEAARRSWSEASPRHQQVGATWMRRLPFAPNDRQIVDVPGIQSALCAVVAATTSPGDLVVSASLSHPAMKLLAEDFGLKIRGLRLDAEGVDPEHLEWVCRRAHPRLLYCAPTIHSPTTATMSVQRRMQIADVAERCDILIVEDEYAAFMLRNPIQPVSGFAPHRSFFIGDLWMTLSLGLRQTYVHAPPTLLGHLSRTVASTCGVTPVAIADIAAYWIESDWADRLIEARRTELEARNALALEILGRSGLHQHPCGHHVWLELPAAWEREAFLRAAEDRGIALNGAAWFAFGHVPLPNAVRISISNVPDREVLRWALVQLRELLA